LAIALQRKNDLVSAERFLREARKRLPIYFAALTEKIAVVMYLKGNKTGALEELESARARARTELLPTSKNVFLRLGMLYGELGDRTKAKADLAEYLKRTENATDPQILAERKAAAEMFRSLN
jgi:predicted Zn-dependent protease